MQRNLTAEECPDCVKKWSGTGHYMMEWKYQCSLCDNKICEDHFSRCDINGCQKLGCNSCNKQCSVCERIACFTCEKTHETQGGNHYCCSCLEKELWHSLDFQDWTKEAVNTTELQFPGVYIDSEDHIVDLDDFFF